MHGRQVRTVLGLILTVCVGAFDPSLAAAGPRYRADEWITECDSAPNVGAADCSITVPFWQTQREIKGSFALVIMLQTSNIGIVGCRFPRGLYSASTKTRRSSAVKRDIAFFRPAKHWPS
jgi:hypothetical protein